MTASLLCSRRRLTDIFRKGRKHFRRTLSRGRSDDELQTRTQAPPTPPRSTSTSGATATPPTAAVGGARDVEKPPEGAEGVVSLPKTPKTPKESIQEWIQKQASGFVERWSEAAEKNPALEVVKRLQEASEQLEVDSLESMEALRVSRRRIGMPPLLSLSLSPLSPSLSPSLPLSLSLSLSPSLPLSLPLSPSLPLSFPPSLPPPPSPSISLSLVVFSYMGKSQVWVLRVCGRKGRDVPSPLSLYLVLFTFMGSAIHGLEGCGLWMRLSLCRPSVRF